MHQSSVNGSVTQQRTGYAHPSQNVQVLHVTYTACRTTHFNIHNSTETLHYMVMSRRKLWENSRTRSRHRKEPFTNVDMESGGEQAHTTDDTEECNDVTC